MVFCTLFDSNYLDKGIALYHSLTKVSKNFKLYVLAMDNKCFDIMSVYNYENVILISINEIIEKMNLKKAKENRSNGEFCWTCTSHLIDYVLTFFNEEICTYVDSDLYFYQDPQCLIDEMGSRTVQIIEHRFTNSIDDQYALKQSGRYCVEFNTFKNTKDAMELLKWWEQQCIVSCSIKSKDEKVFGDQKYLEGWEDKENVSILQHLGGGVAPWNIRQYRLVSSDNNSIVLADKKTKMEFDLIFYHFHCIEYISEKKANISVYKQHWGVDKKLVDCIYLPYLRELDGIKNELKKEFGIFPILYKHPVLSQNTAQKKNVFYYMQKIKKNGIKGIYKKINTECRNKLNASKDIIQF